MKKTELHGYVYCFSVDYNSIDVDDILNVHKYLMKEHNVKLCLDYQKNVYWIIKRFHNKKFWLIFSL